jgi:hypothetical protein
VFTLLYIAPTVFTLLDMAADVLTCYLDTADNVLSLPDTTDAVFSLLDLAAAVFSPGPGSVSHLHYLIIRAYHHHYHQPLGFHQPEKMFFTKYYYRILHVAEFFLPKSQFEYFHFAGFFSFS